MAVKVERLEELGLNPSKPVTPSDAPILNCALNYIEPLSNANLSNADIADKTGLEISSVGTYRSILIKYGFIGRKTEKPKRIGSVRRLEKFENGRKIYFRCPPIHVGEMECAELDPKGNYFCIIRPGKKQFTIKILNQQEAAVYKASQA